jgi:hypothetical protein
MAKADQPPEPQPENRDDAPLPTGGGPVASAVNTGVNAGTKLGRFFTGLTTEQLQKLAAVTFSVVVIAKVGWNEVRDYWQEEREAQVAVVMEAMDLSYNSQEKERERQYNAGERDKDRQLQKYAIDSWRTTSGDNAKAGREVAKQFGFWSAKFELWVDRMEGLEKAIRQSLPLKVLTEFMPRLLSGPVDVAPMPREVVSVGAAVGGECIPPRADTSGPPRPGAGRP